jgi:hypothetical protein
VNVILLEADKNGAISMDSLEVSFEILKIITSNNDFNTLDLEERRTKALESFEIIYRKVREVKTEATLTNLPNKIDRLSDVYRRISSMEGIAPDALKLLNSQVRSDTQSCR